MIKLRYLVIGALAIAASVTALDGVFSTESGNVSVHKRMGRVIDETAPGGPYFKIPFVDTVVDMNVRTIGNTVVVKGRTADQQELDVIVKVQWSIAPLSRKGALNLSAQEAGEVEQYIGDASSILVTYGSREEFNQTMLDPRIIEVVTDFVSKKKLATIVKERALFTSTIVTTIRTKLAEFPITIDGIQVIDIRPSAQYTKAIEAKQLAEVNAQKAIEEAKGINTLAEANKNKVKKEADAYAYGVQVKAAADATGITAKADALAKAGPSYLEFTAITTWDGALSKVVGGSNGVDFGIGASIGKTIAAKELK